jgi:hypothetical protein
MIFPIKPCIILTGLLLTCSSLFGQVEKFSFPMLQPSDFKAYLEYLSSDKLEGREVGTPGSDSASLYIAKNLQNIGLQAFYKIGGESSYLFQYPLLKQSVKGLTLSINDRSGKILQTINAEFSEENGYFNSDFIGRFPPVFCGYGIQSKELNYDDYNKIDVRGKAVLILEGYPGCRDSLSFAYKTFKTINAEETIDFESKMKTALEHGASCLIIIRQNEATKDTFPEYTDAAYFLHDQPDCTIPCLSISKSEGEQLLNNNRFNLNEDETRIAKNCKAEQFSINGKTLSICLTFDNDSVQAKNIAGLLPGKDSTKLIIVGAHYDHLGKRGNHIYNGANDNASGTSGVLCLANYFVKSGYRPNHSILFALWDAEEKGLLGSSRFVESDSLLIKSVIEYINMDMISRSAPEDTLQRILSIGTRPCDDHLRITAKTYNTVLPYPFVLDLWDVTGHYGSDYASFRDKNIPVMTFFSGFHNDYHTPYDDFALLDLEKMSSILNYVGILICILDQEK